MWCKPTTAKIQDVRATFSALKTHKRLAVYTDYHEPRVYWEYLKTTTGTLGSGLLYLQFLCPTDMIIHTALNLLYGTQFEASQSRQKGCSWYLQHVSTGSKYRSCIKDNKLVGVLVAFSCWIDDKFVFNWILKSRGVTNKTMNCSL